MTDRGPASGGSGLFGHRFDLPPLVGGHDDGGTPRRVLQGTLSSDARPPPMTMATASRQARLRAVSPGGGGRRISLQRRCALRRVSGR